MHHAFVILRFKSLNTFFKCYTRSLFFHFWVSSAHAYPFLFWDSGFPFHSLYHSSYKTDGCHWPPATCRSKRFNKKEKSKDFRFHYLIRRIHQAPVHLIFPETTAKQLGWQMFLKFGKKTKKKNLCFSTHNVWTNEKCGIEYCSP